MFKRQKSKNAGVYESVTEGLKQVYKDYLLPLEKEYHFHEFHSPKLDDPDFDGKPLVMLVGQYSTGKTTFIKYEINVIVEFLKTFSFRYLIGEDFPGMRIGPEPTTDTFHIVDYGIYVYCRITFISNFVSFSGESGKIPGNVLAVDTKKPFTQLSNFGGTFLSRY